MMPLEKKHPDILEEFQAGKFVNKSGNKLSAIAIGQYHGQNNAIIKGTGGAVGLTENPGALRRWMVAGPKVVRVLMAFEEDHLSTSPKERKC